MEFGIQMHTIDKFQKLLINIHLILLFFIHQVENKEFWTNDFRWTSEAEYYQRYQKCMML